MENNNFEEIVYGRRSIRSYKEEVRISREEILEMIEKATLAPSAVNMQPWRFVIVKSPEAKAKLRPLMRLNTNQTDTSAAMILVFGDRECYKYGEQIYDQAVREGNMTKETRNRQVKTFIPHYQNFSKEKMDGVLRIDASLVAMQLMLVARNYGYDTCPITGFEADQLAETFDLDPERYLPVIILSIGEAAEEGHSPIRLPVDELVHFK